MKKPEIKKQQRREGYPSYEKVMQGVSIIIHREPSIVYRVCAARLQDPTVRRTKALLQAFRNKTLAEHWVLSDIEKRHNYRMFPHCRKKHSTSYNTDKIAATIERSYKARVESKFKINKSLLSGMWDSLAAMLSIWLQQIAEAKKKNLYKKYYQSAAFVIPFGHHINKTLGDVGRDRVKGYLSLPTHQQCKEALGHLESLLNDYPEDTELRKQSEEYILPITEYEGIALGKRRPSTLQHIQTLVQRDLERMAQIDALKAATETFLNWCPPGFPSVHGDGISPSRQLLLANEYTQALTNYGLDIGIPLVETEHQRFRVLQQAAYRHIQPPKYRLLIWGRADAISRPRDMGIGYDIKKKQYVLFAYLLNKDSRHKRPVMLNKQPTQQDTDTIPTDDSNNAVDDEQDIQHKQEDQGVHIIDINNPDIRLKDIQHQTQAMLFHLQFGEHQQHLLDQARQETAEWKRRFLEKKAAKYPEEWANRKTTASGSVRSASLHAYFDTAREQWWFEVCIMIGNRPKRIKSPDHVLGIHVDPKTGLTATVLTLRGKWIATYQLDEQTIAALLRNDPGEAAKDPLKRAATEYHHRVADALYVLAKKYAAYVGIENIDYRQEMMNRRLLTGRNGSESIKSIRRLLDYKLQLAELAPSQEINGLAPRRDCSACGRRNTQPSFKNQDFICQHCGYRGDKAKNAAAEVARRHLWNITLTRPPRQKKLTS